MVLFPYEKFIDYFMKLMDNKKIFYSIQVKVAKNLMDAL